MVQVNHQMLEGVLILGSCTCINKIGGKAKYPNFFWKTLSSHYLQAYLSAQSACNLIIQKKERINAKSNIQYQLLHVNVHLMQS